MRNLTPHPIRVFPPSTPDRIRVEGDRFFHPETGEEIFPLLELPPDPSGPLRLEEVDEEGDPVRVGDVEVPVVLRLYRVPDPPPPGEAVIVSLALAQAWAREYVAPEGIFIPDTGSGAVRDEKGNVVGTRRLIRIVG